MWTKIVIGFSQAADPQEAAYQAAISVQSQLNAPSTNMVLVFACTSYAGPEILEVIHAILHPQRLVGSSTPGIILSEGIFTRGIAILAINSDDITFGAAASRPGTDGDLRAIGFEWARKLNADCKMQKHQACLMFTDASLHHNAQFIHGMQEILGLGLPIVGAVNSGNPKLQRNSQFYEKQALPQSAAGLLIGGVNIAVGNKHGFKPLGKPRIITRCSNNIITAIDDQPASHIYQEFLGPEAYALNKTSLSSHAVLYPLGIYMEDWGQYLLKNAVDILPDGSIVCQGEVPQGAEVHLMIGNRDSLKHSATDAAMQVKEGLKGRQARLIIIIESVVRHKILKKNAFVEIQAIKEVLGYTTPIIGMYTSGEIIQNAPKPNVNDTHIQNESISILAID